MKMKKSRIKTQDPLRKQINEHKEASHKLPINGLVEREILSIAPCTFYCYWCECIANGIPSRPIKRFVMFISLIALSFVSVYASKYELQLICRQRKLDR